MRKRALWAGILWLAVVFVVGVLILIVDQIYFRSALTRVLRDLLSTNKLWESGEVLRGVDI